MRAEENTWANPLLLGVVQIPRMMSSGRRGCLSRSCGQGSTEFALRPSAPAVLRQEIGELSQRAASERDGFSEVHARQLWRLVGKFQPAAKFSCGHHLVCLYGLPMKTAFIDVMQGVQLSLVQIVHAPLSIPRCCVIRLQHVG